MIKIAFLLGRPGTGKSTLAQLIEASAQRKGWATQHFYDYKYLQDMFLQEIEKNVPPAERAFCQKGPQTYRGFDVVRFEVLDTALKQMANDIQIARSENQTTDKLFLIEFARKENCRALHIFDYDILRDAYLFYIKLSSEACIERLRRRVVENCSRTKFDHFVSEEIMSSYYSTDDWVDGRMSEYLDYLQRDHIDLNFRKIDNLGTYHELEDEAEKLVDLVIPELVTAS